MAYTAETLIHIKCESLPLLNSASGSLLTSVGTGGTIVDGPLGSGLQLSDNQYYTLASGSTLTNAFTLAFWLKPTFPGVATDGSATYELRQALIAKSTFSYDSGTGVTTSSSNAFNVYEETRTDGQKQLVVVLGSTGTLVSSPYSAGIFHYFWIAFSYTGGYCKIFIDLVEDVGAVLTGTLPSSLPNVAININRTTTGEQYQVARNTGVLDDVVLFNTAKISLSDMARAANIGAEYIANSTYIGVEEIDQAIVFDDIDSVQVNGIYANRGNLYVARSDGKLLKGTRLLWQNRRNFSQSSELGGLTRLKTSDDSTAVIESGALKIVNETIRI